jgi:uncharacterized protein YndB with AHSA1/START domain
MEGFLTGFQLTPKPIKGLVLTEVSKEISIAAPIKNILSKITTGPGLSKWLGTTSTFTAHVGIKFTTEVADEKSKGVITALDLPRRVVFMIEALGEFDFGIKTKESTVILKVKVRRSVLPAEVNNWHTTAEKILNQLESAVTGD